MLDVLLVVGGEVGDGGLVGVVELGLELQLVDELLRRLREVAAVVVLLEPVDEGDLGQVHWSGLRTNFWKTVKIH